MNTDFATIQDYFDLHVKSFLCLINSIDSTKDKRQKTKDKRQKTKDKSLKTLETLKTLKNY